MGRKFHAGKFAYVEEGAVVATFNTLPKSYQGQDLEDLKAIGFYPLTDQKPLVESWETLTVDGYSIGSSTVSVVYSQEFNLDAYKAVQRNYIKTSAGNRILALDPSWTSSNVGERQRNALMKAVKLLRKITTGTASAGEIAIADALEALSDEIEAIRQQSNTSEAAVAAASDKTGVDSAVATWDAWTYGG